MQLQGCRRWTVYDGPVPGHVEYPFENGHDQCFASGKGCDPAAEAKLGSLPSRSFELRPGSMLYLPWRRNLPHRTAPCEPANSPLGPANPESERSLHWSLTSPGYAKAAASFLFNAVTMHLNEQVGASPRGPLSASPQSCLS